MKTEQLRDEMANLLKPYTNILMRESAAQAIIDHIAPMMREVVSTLRAIEDNGTFTQIRGNNPGKRSKNYQAKLANKARLSIPEAWRK